MCASFITAECSSVGGRQSQEDRVVAIPDLNKYVPISSRRKTSASHQQAYAAREPRRSFYAVFDGHGGQGCSDFLAKRFHLELAKSPLLQTDPKTALWDVWDSMDILYYEACVQKRKTTLSAARKKSATVLNGPGAGPSMSMNSAGGETKTEVDPSRGVPATAAFPYDGSTATAVLIVGEKIFIANCGDSAGALMRADGSVEVLTTDHGTLNKNETERVELSGGSLRDQTVRSVMPSPFCCLRRTEVVGKPRAYPGGLLVTRAFGNFHSKVVSLGGTPGVIIPDCEEVLEMTVGNDWSELILATDGVWDIVEPPELPELLAQLDGSARKSAAVALSVNRSNRLDAIREEDDEDAEDTDSSGHSPSAREEAKRIEQAYLNSTCARLVLSCVRHRYWEKHRAPADNTSVVIIKFQEHDVQSPPTRSPVPAARTENETTTQSREPAASIPEAPNLDCVANGESAALEIQATKVVSPGTQNTKPAPTLEEDKKVEAFSIKPVAIREASEIDAQERKPVPERCERRVEGRNSIEKQIEEVVVDGGKFGVRAAENRSLEPPNDGLVVEECESCETHSGVVESLAARDKVGSDVTASQEQSAAARHPESSASGQSGLGSQRLGESVGSSGGNNGVVRSQGSALQCLASSNPQLLVKG